MDAAPPHSGRGQAAAAIEALGRSAGKPAGRCGARKRSECSEAEEMAAEQLYPRSSIEDDFNYGSNVASASVHIRMGRAGVGEGPRVPAVSAGEDAAAFSSSPGSPPFLLTPAGLGLLKPK